MPEAYEFEGSQLKQIADNKIYKYNESGIRKEKIIEGVITKYKVEGNKIVEEQTGNERTKYYYEEERLIGIGVNNKIYYYVRILIGEIIGIIRNDGVVLVSYSYDSWGEIISTSVNSDEVYAEEGNLVKNHNHYLYKGYYYDEETGYYYCNARYYNPEIGRWISPDGIEYLDPASINGLNLYAYCGNNPVMFSDSSGCSPWSDFWDGVGDWFGDHWKEIVIGTAFIVGGAIVTALTCGAGTTAWAALGSALLTLAVQVSASIAVGVGVNGLVNLANGNDFFANVGDATASSFMWGGIFSGGAQMLSGGFRLAKQAFGFKGIDTKYFGML